MPDLPDLPFAITDDQLLGGRVRLRQPARGYRVAVDPVLLAAAVPARAGQRVLDLGCGTGAVALCLSARVPGLAVQGLELQAPLWQLAVQNMTLNKAPIEILHGDVAAPPADLWTGVDHVVINPPFHAAAGRSPSPDPIREQAHASPVPLGHWLALAAERLIPAGLLSVVFPAAGLARLLEAVPGSFGPLCLWPILPRAGQDPRRLLLAAQLGGVRAIKTLPPLVLHEADGTFTKIAEAVLRGMAPLVWPRND